MRILMSYYWGGSGLVRVGKFIGFNYWLWGNCVRRYKWRIVDWIYGFRNCYVVRWYEGRLIYYRCIYVMGLLWYELRVI